MSGFSPQGKGVQSGNYPGRQCPVIDGEPGVETYHVKGDIVDGCQVGGSFPQMDELNAILLSLNYILTEGGTKPLPTECAVDNPALLFNKLTELFSARVGCPPLDDFTISADKLVATYNGTEDNVLFSYYRPQDATLIDIEVSTGDTFSLSHDNFDILVPGSAEVVVNGVAYGGTPPTPPNSTVGNSFIVPTEGVDSQLGVYTLNGLCPEITLTTDEFIPGSPIPEQYTTIGVFRYARA